MTFYIGLYERGDDENRFTGRKWIKIKNLIKKIDSFVRFCIQTYKHQSAMVFIVCIQKLG